MIYVYVRGYNDIQIKYIVRINSYKANYMLSIQEIHCTFCYVCMQRLMCSSQYALRCVHVPYNMNFEGGSFPDFYPYF